MRTYPDNHQSRLMKDPIKALEEKYDRLEQAGTLAERKRELLHRRMRQLMAKSTVKYVNTDKKGRKLKYGKLRAEHYIHVPDKTIRVRG